MGNVMGDLSSCRGIVQGMEDIAGSGKIVRAEVPLAEMFGTRPRCARSPRAAPRTRWSSSTTQKRRTTSRKPS
ncbi:MAG: Translation elongation factor G [uncultured Caballeronia sp.]|nr:MAG: Translation elongation factor G [uncultured Caballeronia sp.]